MSILLSKSEYRKLLKARRASIPPSEREEWDVAIAQTLFSLPIWRSAHIVHCYSSFGTEVATRTIIECALEENKQVIVPVVPAALHNNVHRSANDAALEHYLITAATHFAQDAFGIPTPKAEHSTQIQPASLMRAEDCVLVPLLGFDNACFRLGYGKGYYDRFLQTIPNVPRIGLAFSCQRVAALPHEVHDVPLSMVITEQCAVVPESQ